MSNYEDFKLSNLQDGEEDHEEETQSSSCDGGLLLQEEIWVLLPPADDYFIQKLRLNQGPPGRDALMKDLTQVHYGKCRIQCCWSLSF